MTITITKVRDVAMKAGAEQALYRLSEPITYGWNNDQQTEYVVISALTFAFDHAGSETFIFPADEHGEVVDWGELDGSQRGTTSHAAVIAAAGWELAS